MTLQPKPLKLKRTELKPKGKRWEYYFKELNSTTLKILEKRKRQKEEVPGLKHKRVATSDPIHVEEKSSQQRQINPRCIWRMRLEPVQRRKSSNRTDVNSANEARTMVVPTLVIQLVVSQKACDSNQRILNPRWYHLWKDLNHKKVYTIKSRLSYCEV